MPINRRKLLLAGSMLPTLTSCATDLWKYRDRPAATLARDLNVCSATYAILKAGAAQPAIAISGCGDPAEMSRPDAIFQAASLTKPVVAFAALRLVLAGQLDLDARVSRYLPRGYRHYQSVLARGQRDASDIVPASALSGIPVATLLNHTSGLPNWASGKLSFDFKLGERWSYSGEGYLLLQSVIEAVVGMDLAAYFGKHVFGPLGMQGSSLVWKHEFADRARAGASVFGNVRPIRFGLPVAAASLYTTAADYARFMSALLSDDQLVALTLSRPVVVGEQGDLGLEWGLGWGIERGPGGPYLWQWGNNPGFRAFAMASVSSKDGFVVLTNNERGMALAVPIASQALPGEHNAFRFSRVGS